ncbi:ArsR/SmtB family transcription factor [Mahella australiensis]|uniref:Transcriptional regulator, ArsR family n=1 Tax=Mahella australiensis (strain DSM 15567 / CIP 107919 / 50-1 BON) TaxID=697281 RepID=F4A148_MAHA5|nr:metalloregulator ArsR/SmtB family transcription factor [Mahella australiensis]AEE95951.1 transcriptional regulator, ArsR family [Mahella australiensis 50-1 BON]
MSNVDEMSDIFKALSDPMRLKVLKLLPKHGEEKELCVCALADELGISQPNVSHHLKILKSVGLVKCAKHEGFSYYAVNMDKIKCLFDDLQNEIEK